MLTEAVEAALVAQGLSVRRILVAVSGGIDSTALLHALVEISKRQSLAVVVGHVNHGLRDEESDAEERFVHELAEKLALECLTSSVEPGRLVEGRSNRARPTLQEAARHLRYEALYRMAEDCRADAIATAHNQDDQAETVLMRLLRGTGPAGLAGIPERSVDGRLVRPLLGVSRAQIVEYTTQRAIEWREDSSNDGDAYTRNRIRRHWLPALAEEFNPQLRRALAQVAEAQRRDIEWIDGLVDEAESHYLITSSCGSDLTLRRDGWCDLPEALARRLVQRALARMGCGRDATRVHIERVLEFVRGFDTRDCGSTLELPGGLRLTQQRSGFSMSRTPGGA